jgi:hypothetical protein
MRALAHLDAVQARLTPGSASQLAAQIAKIIQAAMQGRGNV